MSKREADSCRQISISWLQKHGYFPQESSYKSGSITWTSHWGDKNSISLTVKTNSAEMKEPSGYVRFNYTHTDGDGNKNNMDYEVALTTTECNYGGVRYWFVCPLVKNGRPCRRRVGVLYMYSKYFGCRHCGELTYASRNQGGQFRYSVSIPDLEEQEAKIGRYFYDGKPTRKYRRLMKMERQFRQSILLMGELAKKSLNKFK
jgi:hypothetical protein